MFDLIFGIKGKKEKKRNMAKKLNAFHMIGLKKFQKILWKFSH